MDPRGSALDRYKHTLQVFISLTNIFSVASGSRATVAPMLPQSNPQPSNSVSDR